MFRELCGDSTLKNVVLVTNMWGEVSLEDGEDRENQLSDKFFKPVIDKGAQMVRHHNTAQSSHDIIRRIMENHPVVLQIQQELVDDRKGIVDTSAGGVINQELNHQIKRYEAELRKVQEDMIRALKKKDEETRQEFEEDRREMQEKMDKMRKDSEEMALRYAETKQRMEAKVKEMERQIEELRGLVMNPTYK